MLIALGLLLSAVAGVWWTSRERPGLASVLEASVLQVYSLQDGDFTELAFGEGTHTYAVLTPRCLRCVRYSDDILDILAELPGEDAVIGPSRSELEVLKQFGLELPAYAVIDEDRLTNLGISIYPTIIHIKAGSVRFVWRDIPSLMRVRIARIRMAF